MSVLVIRVVSLIRTLLPSLDILIEDDSTVLAVVSVIIFSDLIVPDTTWYLRILDKVSLFSGLRSAVNTPSGSFLKALLLGANTVNGPLSESVSARPAALIAVTNVVSELSELATPTILEEAYTAVEEITDTDNNTAVISLIIFMVTKIIFTKNLQDYITKKSSI
jgi:hypothetical protein